MKMNRREFMLKASAACVAPAALLVCRDKVPASKSKPLIGNLNEDFAAIEKHDVKPFRNHTINYFIPEKGKITKIIMYEDGMKALAKSIQEYEDREILYAIASALEVPRDFL